ncbi:centrosomal protein of 44 kDa isoform X2 [Hemicordylus capensis]|uniref:centrosomal protein of 44 kDa isoform X2 n=1 Tax=Hemicordylus capensis TaxID=884348 RepID=UPI00230214F5|nr:centrosomal protein of 44 kDa isoform X2 [Hemicordylus capensis]
MATGDLKGNLRKIEQGLRLLNYPRDVDYTGLAKGDPSAFLPIVSYCFTSFSTQITELLVESNVELTAKNDSRFVDAIYKFLRDQFQYKPVLSKQQFLQYGFAERKIQIVCDIISLIYKRHKELSNINKVKSQTRKKTHCVTSQLYVNTLNLDSAAISTTNFQEKPQVECHTSPLNAHIPEDKIDDVVEEESEVVCDAKILDNVHEMTDISAEFNIMNEENVSSRNMTPIFPEREKVELPESLHQSSGYSSLLSADPSPKAMVVNHGPSEVSKETTIQRMERISKMIEETSELLKTSSTTS